MSITIPHNVSIELLTSEKQDPSNYLVASASISTAVKTALASCIMIDVGVQFDRPFYKAFCQTDVLFRHARKRACTRLYG